MTFKMREAPIKPVRLTRYESFHLDSNVDGITLTDLLRDVEGICNRLEVPYNPDAIVFEYDWSYESQNCSLRIDYPEPEEDYKFRVAKYEKDLAAYNTWLEKNQAKIAKFNADKELKENKARQKTVAALKKQKAQLEKRIKQMEDSGG